MSLISIIIPVFFNENTLNPLSKRLSDFANSMPEHDFEFIYVDDGSKDASYEKLKQLADLDSRIKVIKLVRNFGSEMAIYCGISHAEGDCVGFIAADLQDPPEALKPMIDLWESGIPIVLATRKDRKGDPIFTRLFSYVFNTLFKLIVYPDFSPQGIGFFLVDRKVASTLLQCQERNSHLIGLIIWTGFPYETVDYDRIDRKDGVSRWSFRKKVKYFLDAFVGFSYIPLRITSSLGLLLAFFGGIYAIFVLINRLLNNIIVPGWTTLTIMTLFLSGIQLIMLGVIGEYLWRNFDATRNRPMFIVDEIISHE